MKIKAMLLSIPLSIFGMNEQPPIIATVAQTTPYQANKIRSLEPMQAQQQSASQNITIDQPKTPPTNLNISNNPIAELQSNLEYKRQQRLLITTSVALSCASFGAYVYYLVKHKHKPQPQKRFISDAIAATSLTASMLQGAAGCVASAYGIYKVRSWLYDGYVEKRKLEEKLTNLKKDFNTQIASRDAMLNRYAAAINAHAQMLDSLAPLPAQVKELELVARSHATDLDEHRNYLQTISREAQAFAHAINHNGAQTTKNAADIKNLAAAITSSKINVSKQIQEIAQQIDATLQPVPEPPKLTTPRADQHAAIPSQIKTPSPNSSQGHAATVAALPLTQSNSGFCPCCSEDSVSVK